MKKKEVTKSVEEQVKELISEVTEKPVDDIHLEDNIITDLEIESLDLIDLITKFEDTFGLEVEDKDIKYFQTVSDIINYIKNHV